MDLDRAAGDARPVNQVVHPVQAPQERGLTATGRTDERGDILSLDLQVDVVQCLRRVVEKI